MGQDGLMASEVREGETLGVIRRPAGGWGMEGAQRLNALIRLPSFASGDISTDDISVRGGAAWRRIEGCRELLSAVTPEQLRAWQDALGYVKFAVPVQPRPYRIVVGNRPHIEIAGGPVVAAGLLYFHFGRGRPTVAELENTSGGFRPGPLRNATAADAIRAAGYTIEEHGQHDNPTGDYDRSIIAPGGRRRTPQP